MAIPALSRIDPAHSPVAASALPQACVAAKISAQGAADLFMIPVREVG